MVALNKDPRPRAGAQIVLQVRLDSRLIGLHFGWGHLHRAVQFRQLSELIFELGEL